MKVYVPVCGESIDEAIENALNISIKAASHHIPSSVSFSFNGIEMVVDAMKNNNDYYKLLWETKCKERRDVYKLSEEYKQAKSDQVLRTTLLQSDLDKHIINLQYNIHTNHHPLDLCRWLKRFVELSDNINVTYNKQEVLDKLDFLGYKENEYVGYTGEWTIDISIKYITGQVINCLNTIGLIPSIVITMCDKVLKTK